MTIPNILSSFRLILAPVLLVLAWSSYSTGFMIVLIIAFLLDAVDGPIARWLNQESELGPKLDSWADFSIYLTFLIGAWWLWPEIVMRELIFILLTLASIIFPVIMSIYKFRKVTSYHTWLVKIAAVCMAPSAILLFLIDYSWTFRLASIVCVMASIEEILITMVLKKPHSNVQSIFHVRKDCVKKMMDK